MESGSNDRRRPVRGAVSRGILTIAVICGVLLGGAYLAMRTTAPDEKDRVRHAAGFSIIHPPGWEVDSISLPTDGSGRAVMKLSPAKFIGKPPSLTIMRLGAPPDTNTLLGDGYAQMPFQGTPSWLKRDISKRSTTLELYLDRSGTWFLCSLNLPGLEAAKESDYFPYLQSLKTDRPPRETTTR